MEAHSFSTCELDPEAYGAALLPFIGDFVVGRNGITDEQAQAWISEQQQLGQRAVLLRQHPTLFHGHEAALGQRGSRSSELERRPLSGSGATPGVHRAPEPRDNDWAFRPSPTRALPAECTPGPSHHERTGTRRPGCRDVRPEPSVGSFTVESKRARSTGPTRRWTVPECA